MTSSHFFNQVMLYLWNMFHRLPELLRSNVVLCSCSCLATLVHIISASLLVNKFQTRTDADAVVAAGGIAIVGSSLFCVECVYYAVKMRAHGPFISSAFATILQQ